MAFMLKRFLNRIVRLYRLIILIIHSEWLRNMLQEEKSIKISGKTKYYSDRIRKFAKRCGNDLRVNNPCVFTGDIYFGNNCNFNGMQVLGGGRVTFGNNFHSGINCMILTQNHNYDKGQAIPYDDTYITKEITIKDNVWLGNNVIIVGNIIIGEGAIVAAGSVVSKSIPDYAIVGGNPAKIIKYRDIDHYKKLKAENKTM